MKHLIIGGARSGKSRQAEGLAQAWAGPVSYIATADTRQNDREMDQRIATHQQRRPEHWELLEAPLDLAASLHAQDHKQGLILVDCLTLWLANCLAAGEWPQRRIALLDAVDSLASELVLVSNEVGMGIVPLGELSRQFVDESGFLHQALAQRCDRVVFMAAGLPLVMKAEQ